MESDPVGEEQIAAVQSLMDALEGKLLDDRQRQRATELLRAMTLLLATGLRFPQRLEGFGLSVRDRPGQDA